ncbi:folate family ECF transporter S component [Ruminococcus sp.]|uniref:folate family ECF transporter S component n=1 Tax=Ruminococcus sp. TaxID=41978 RepID=UPI0025FC3B09|nr:folate family ECF transporter S component [Ruminococcus sp.]MBQ8966672.1 folate family ECF transporter S component [Ruminococcus sp.]
MKSFFSSFSKSAKELTDLRCLCVTAIFIALSMLLESVAINTPYFKISFAYLAAACIGMLFGPTVGFFAGLICDVVGYIANPAGAPFLPAYTLVQGMSGLIYGAVLYYKVDYSIFAKKEDPFKDKKSKNGLSVQFFVRIVIAKLLNITIINIFINTALNMHYGFIPKQAYSVAIAARVIKNLTQLAADIPLMFVVIPSVFVIYKRAFRTGTAA